jgi:CheY-like chemotaxis protein
LMDLLMPEMNGFEATEYIRNTMKSKVPIIALTADVTTVDLAKCKAIGMNDYVAKPVDERLLYHKIVGLAKKAALSKNHGEQNKVTLHSKKLQYIDLSYLRGLTKSNPELMMEMITLYLEQTPPLLMAMNRTLKEQDWPSLHAAVHKMIPSFAIMGISKEYENMAKTIQEFAVNQQHPDTRTLEKNGIPGMAQQLESVCTQACRELEEAFKQLKTTHE